MFSHIFNDQYLRVKVLCLMRHWYFMASECISECINARPLAADGTDCHSGEILIFEKAMHIVMLKILET